MVENFPHPLIQGRMIPKEEKNNMDIFTFYIPFNNMHSLKSAHMKLSSAPAEQLNPICPMHETTKDLGRA